MTISPVKKTPEQKYRKELEVIHAGGADYIPPALWGKHDFALVAVTQDGRCLNHVPKNLRWHRDIVLAAVTSRGIALSWAPTSLRDDPEIVTAAVTQNPYALTYAGPQCKANRDIVLTAVTQMGAMLQFADPALRANKGFVMRCLAESNDLPFTPVDVFKKHNIWYPDKYQRLDYQVSALRRLLAADKKNDVYNHLTHLCADWPDALLPVLPNRNDGTLEKSILSQAIDILSMETPSGRAARAKKRLKKSAPRRHPKGPTR